MESSQTFYADYKHSHQCTNNHIETPVRKKRSLVIKNKALRINLKNTFIELSDGLLSQIYGVEQLEAIYIHKDIELNLATAYELSTYIRIYFIDAKGHILARYERMYTV